MLQKQYIDIRTKFNQMKFWQIVINGIFLTFDYIRFFLFLFYFVIQGEKSNHIKTNFVGCVYTYTQ